MIREKFELEVHLVKSDVHKLGKKLRSLSDIKRSRHRGVPETIIYTSKITSDAAFIS